MEGILVVDLFIFGIYLKSAQKSLIKEGNDLTIAKALRIAEMEEMTCKQAEAICVLLKESRMHQYNQRARENQQNVDIVAETTLEGSAKQEGKNASYAIKKNTLQMFAIQRSKIKNNQRSNKATAPEKKEGPHSNTK